MSKFSFSKRKACVLTHSAFFANVNFPAQLWHFQWAMNTSVNELSHHRAPPPNYPSVFTLLGSAILLRCFQTHPPPKKEGEGDNVIGLSMCLGARMEHPDSQRLKQRMRAHAHTMVEERTAQCLCVSVNLCAVKLRWRGQLMPDPFVKDNCTCRRNLEGRLGGHTWATSYSLHTSRAKVWNRKKRRNYPHKNIKRHPL